LFPYENGIVPGTLQELLEWKREGVKSGRKIAFTDTETTGLDPHSDKLLLIQYGDREVQFVIDARNVVLTDAVKKELFEDQDFTLVLQNAIFDYNMLKQIKVVLRKVYDTMLAEKIMMRSLISADEIKFNSPFTLAAMCRKYLGIALSKEERETFIGHKGEFKVSQIIYAANDCKYLDMLHEKIHEEIRKQDLLNTLRLENEYCLAAGDMIYNGVYLNQDKWKELYNTNMSLLKEMEFELDGELMKEDNKVWRKYNKAQLDLFGARTRILALNYNSNKEMKRIFKMLGIELTDKYGDDTISIKELEKIKDKTRFISKYIEYKKLDKLATSFGLSWIKDVNPHTGRIHFSLDQVLDTGRTASYRPNFYQVPADNRYRNCFEGQNGNVFVGGDYSSQEGKIMADKAKDPEYIHFFNYGHGDPHSFVATTMFTAKYGMPFEVPPKIENDPVKLAYFESHPNKKYRGQGKILNFFLSYGGSAFTLSLTLGIPMDESQELIDAFWLGFPTLQKMFEYEKVFAIENGYSISNNITKRRRYYPEWQEWKDMSARIQLFRTEVGDQKFFEILKEEKAAFNYLKELDENNFLSEYKMRKYASLYLLNKKQYKLKGEIERAAMNYPIQGTAADMTKTACIFIRRKYIENGILPFADATCKLVLMPHDEIQTECHPNVYLFGKQILEDAMEQAGKVYVETMSLRPKASVGNCWSK
jgi:DNA polymerase I-like protein with 3'-5' exonuclease and polymerase domains